MAALARARARSRFHFGYLVGRAEAPSRPLALLTRARPRPDPRPRGRGRPGPVRRSRGGRPRVADVDRAIEVLAPALPGFDPWTEVHVHVRYRGHRVGGRFLPATQRLAVTTDPLPCDVHQPHGGGCCRRRPPSTPTA